MGRRSFLASLAALFTRAPGPDLEDYLNRAVRRWYDQVASVAWGK